MARRGRPKAEEPLDTFSIRLPRRVIEKIKRFGLTPEIRDSIQDLVERRTEMIDAKAQPYDAVMDTLPEEATEPILKAVFFRLARAGREDLVSLSRDLAQELAEGSLNQPPQMLSCEQATSLLEATGILLSGHFLRWLARLDASGVNVAALITSVPDDLGFPDEPMPGNSLPKSGSRFLRAANHPADIAQRKARIPDELDDALEDMFPLKNCEMVLREAIRLSSLDSRVIDGDTRDLTIKVAEGIFIPVLADGRIKAAGTEDEDCLHEYLVPALTKELRDHFDEALMSIWAEAFYYRLAALYEEGEGIVKMLLELGTSD